MKLNQYLVQTGMNQSELANTLKVCQSTVHKWIYNKCNPSSRRIMEIHRITNGEVSVEDWLEQKR